MDNNKVYGAFSTKLMNSLSQGSGNVVFSPLSVFVVLCMAAAGASGETRQEILDSIGKGLTVEDLVSISEFLRESDSAVKSANAVCVQYDAADALKNDYLKLVRERFDAKCFSSHDLVYDVNRWVSNKTDNMIPEILDESAEDLLFCLINATTFMSAWDDPYDFFQVHKDNFYNMSGSVSKVDMLYGSEKSYIENSYVRGFMKAYENDRYAFMALLPKRKGEEALRRAIENINFGTLCKKSTWYEVHTCMPEFKYKYDKELSGILTDLGMERMFTDDADFSNMSMIDLYVDKVLHKAYIKVDRNGTKAAAATVMGMVGAGLPKDYKTVTLDRPFIYAIMDVEKNVPVFSGVVREL